MDRLNDEAYMELALQMAEKSLGQTEVNPVVGCVIVKDGRILGRGAQLKRGSHHAEIHALHMAGDEAAGSTVYVTLEPCSHQGKTPPCTESLIRAGVRRVVVATTDPNPRVSGRGIRRLQEAGIEVRTGVLKERAQALNEMYNRFIVRGTPFVTVKTACTLDGKIAAESGDSRWVSGKEAREFVHTLRHRHQAIMVGVNTVIQDDPQLTARLSVAAIQPVRIVVDSSLRLPETSRVITDGQAPTWVLTTEKASKEKVERLREAGIEVIQCGHGPEVDLKLAMQRLGERGIASVLVEGGGRLNGSLLSQRLIDKIIMIIAPKLIGGDEAPLAFRFPGIPKMSEAIRLTQTNVRMLGGDICIEGYPEYGGER